MPAVPPPVRPLYARRYAAVAVGGLLIVIHSADEHTNYSGPTDFKTGYQGLVEARQMGDFEGYVQWGLGTSSMGCYRVFFLPNPDRLVIDIQTS